LGGFLEVWGIFLWFFLLEKGDLGKIISMPVKRGLLDWLILLIFLKKQICLLG